MTKVQQYLSLYFFYHTVIQTVTNQYLGLFEMFGLSIRYQI